MTCPRCKCEQPQAIDCVKCGIIVAKFKIAPPPGAVPVAAAHLPQRAHAPIVQVHDTKPVSPSVAPVPRAAASAKRAHLSARERSVLYVQLARLVRSAVPLPEAFELIGDVLGGAARKPARAVGERIAAGASLSDAAAAAPGLFDPVDVALLRAAESVGQVAEIAERLAERHATTAQLAADLRSSLSYPAFIVLSSVFLTPLPVAFTQSLGAYVSEVAVGLGIVGGCVIAVVLGWRALTASPAWGKMVSLAGNVPLLGALVRNRRQAYWFDVMGRCLSAGLPLPAAVELASVATGEARISALAPAIVEKLRTESLAAGVALLPGLAPKDRARIAAAERSGHTPQACAELAVEARQRFHAGLRLGSVVLRIGISAAIAISIGWQVISQMQHMMGDPLSMIPGQEGADLRRELQKAMPQLQH